MLDLLKIGLIFIVMLFLLRKKWNIGYVMAFASCLVFLLYWVSFPVVLSTILVTLTDTVTIQLFTALTLIRVLEIILRERQVLAAMTEASKNLLRRKKAVIVSMPMLIGLLPSIGGAYFSAPMVEESTRNIEMSAEEKGFINYWFRHPWEFILPLYPGVLLASAVTAIELRSLILSNIPYAALIVMTGFFFGLRKIGGRFVENGSGGVEMKTQTKAGLLWSFLPLGAILIMVIVFQVSLSWSLAITIAALFIFYRFSPQEIMRAVRYGFTIDVLVLIVGAMLFKFSLESSGAVRHLNEYFVMSGIPLLPVFFFLPFITGLLTGLTIGFVGSTFPLLLSIADGSHLNQITFAFAAGFAGVLLSPVHLCLVLTREYFKADLWGIYKKTIPSILVVMAAALAEYVILQ